MLHGLSGHARTWDQTAAALAGRYRVLALDQRGHGDSDWVPRYGLGPMAEDLLAFVDALRLPEVTMMGLSMGGIVSFVFAAAHPERVTRLIVLDIGPEIASGGARNVAASLAANDVFSSEDEAFTQARAANPRPRDPSPSRQARSPLAAGRLAHLQIRQGTAQAGRDIRSDARSAVGGVESGELPAASGAR